MKTIEQKAKAYDDLLVKLQEAKVDNDVCDERYCCVIDNIVPELKESEDEKMIQYFKDLAPFDKAEELYEKYGFSHKDAIAWLEKRVEQKPTEWSEEDKNTLDFLVDYLLDTIKKMPAEEYAGGLGKAVVLLKSLKDRVQPRPHWKPSDEQIEAMQKALVDLCGKDEHNIITGLYYDLKKIREE